MRLIDRKSLEAQIKEAFRENPAVMGMLLHWIRKQPTVDAVPVVRCRGCEYWDDDPDTYGRSGGPLGNCDRMDCTTAHDDFCSYGERRYAADGR